MFLSSIGFYYSTLLFLSAFCSTTFSMYTNGHKTDFEALLDIRNKIVHDPFGVVSSWNHTIHFCKWRGVTCNRRHTRRVVKLKLKSLKLSGTLSPYVGNMSFLNDLMLLNNSFSGRIPPQIGRLRKLKYLILAQNSFTGNIPTNISMCPDLVTAAFDENNLDGEISEEFGSLSRLKIFSVYHNNLTGSIPPSFGNLTALKIIDLTENRFTGAIPHSIGRLKNLEQFLMPGNNLSGMFPLSIFNISSITDIDVGDNELHGSLPMNLGITLPNLHYFSVIYNRFTGGIPVSICNASYAEELQFSGNKFHGSVPFIGNLEYLTIFLIGLNNLGSGGFKDDLSFLNSLTNVTTLEKLIMEDNNFGGLLPQYIGNLSTKLKTWDFSYNLISGSIPDGIENLINLSDFEVTFNQLSGKIPSGIGKLSKLQEVHLGVNNFSSRIPSSLGNLTKLINLELWNNYLEGTIPSSLGNCKNLLSLDIATNNLSGAIPVEIFKISSLSRYLSLAQNRLTGTLPSDLGGSLTNLGTLDLSENMLSGEIPSSIGSCASLETLYLYENRFEGTIPTTLGSVRALQVLDVSVNNFSGALPEFLADFELLYDLNLSYNNFNGKVPTKGIFTNISGLSVTGNYDLCGGIPRLHLSKCTPNMSKKKKKYKSLIAIMGGLSGIALIMLCSFIVWLKKKRMKNALTSSSRIGGESFFRLSYQDLLKATDGFSSENLIGRGGFGSVYKGTLHDQDDAHGINNIVAVKVVNLSNKGASRSFIAECEALKSIKHRNLVKVLTACASLDYQGNDFKALVFEFMGNGSLHDWLHPPRGNDEGRIRTTTLDFIQRLNIAIDAACALEYLHHDCGTPIVHCDLKPSNVLLDNDMIAHVGDFGLAKFLFKENECSTSTESSSIGVRGTIGYAPPEYGVGNKVSRNGDVYSFGILVLELFTGKGPTDCMFKDGLNLRDYVMVALPNNVADIMDPILLDKIDLENLTSVLRIGISCSSELPRERPSMSKVVVQLCSIKNSITSENV